MKKYIIYLSIVIALIDSSVLAFENIRFDKLSTWHGLSQSNIL